MQCPICGYLLNDLDADCPRCLALGARGIDPPTTAQSDSRAAARPSRTALSATSKIVILMGIFAIAIIVTLSLRGATDTYTPPPPPPSAATLTGGDTVLFAKAQALAAAHSSPTGVIWSLEDCAQLVQDKVALGMSFDEVEYVYGKPDKDNCDTSNSGTRDQFVYVGDSSGNDYLYFENLRLTTIQIDGRVLGRRLLRKAQHGHAGDDETIEMQAESDAATAVARQDDAALRALEDANHKSEQKLANDEKAWNDAVIRRDLGDASAQKTVDEYRQKITDDEK